MDLGLDDRSALVTGGGRLGSADCERLAAEGATVVALDVNLDAPERVVADVEDAGGEAHAVECDLTDREDVAATVDAIRWETGGVDLSRFISAVALHQQDAPEDERTASDDERRDRLVEQRRPEEHRHHRYHVLTPPTRASRRSTPS
jgi:NAD(P)-dependent dehydrogenase (short-subunit alcohol dehydrogenase family)